MKMAKSNQPATPEAKSASPGSSTSAPPQNPPLIPPPPLPACLTRKEVAQLVRASVSTVDRLVVDGHLQRVTVRRLVRFSPAEVEAYIKNAEALKIKNPNKTGPGVTPEPTRETRVLPTKNV